MRASPGGGWDAGLAIRGVMALSSVRGSAFGRTTSGGRTRG